MTAITYILNRAVAGYQLPDGFEVTNAARWRGFGQGRWRGILPCRFRGRHHQLPVAASLDGKSLSLTVTDEFGMQRIGQPGQPGGLGEEIARYMAMAGDLHDQTWFDSSTGLMWRLEQILPWTFPTVERSVVELNSGDCPLGFNDWRLATVDELRDIRRRRIDGVPIIFSDAFPELKWVHDGRKYQSLFFWTSTRSDDPRFDVYFDAPGENVGKHRRAEEDLHLYGLAVRRA